jgi:hypothetical protein
MKALEARNLSIESVRDEITLIENKILEACREGCTRIQIDCLSEGSVAYFQDQEFIVNEIFLNGGMVCIIRW